MSWWTKQVLLPSLLLVLCGGGFAVVAAEPGPQGLPPPPPPKKRVKNNAPDKNYWRAFAEMSSEERSAMHRLQQQDQSAYVAKMQQLVEAIDRREKAKQQRVKQLFDAWKKADDGEREKIRQQLRGIVESDYLRRLDFNRRHIADVRRRTEFLEKELVELEINADKNIDAQVKRILKEQKFPLPRKNVAK